jgi:sugar lactone lactonase YvrE
MAAATGESTPGPYAQAKIHTKPGVAPDGKVYFGTKSGKPAADERWQANYPGGHLLVYDPAANRVSDLGIIRPRQSIIAVGVDPRRNLAYAVTDPDGHLFVYDPRARTFSDKGVLTWGPQPSRYLVVLSNGMSTTGRARCVQRLQAATGAISRVPPFLGAGTVRKPDALALSPDGSRFYGVERVRTGVYYPAERALAVSPTAMFVRGLGGRMRH